MTLLRPHSAKPICFLVLLSLTVGGLTRPLAQPSANPPTRTATTVPTQTKTAAASVFTCPQLLPTTTLLALDKLSLWSGGTQLRGANIWQRIRVPDLDGDLLGEGYIGPPYAQSDFNRLAALGANYVNLSIPGLFTERPPYRLDKHAQANLDVLIEMAARADLFVVISFRTGPGRSDFTFYRDGAGDWFDPDLLIETVWTEQAAQDAWAEMWRYTAERYRDNPVVVGYDLMVEPNADEVMLDLYAPADFYPRYAGTLYDWNQFYPRLVTAIREVDVNTPILVNPMGWGSVPWLLALQPVPDERVVYAVHQYGPFQYTHQQPGDHRPYPGEFDVTWDDLPDRFDRDWLLAYLSPLLAFREQTGAPVAVNEFGVVRWAPGAANFLHDEIAFFEQNGINHALWVWEPTYEPWYTWGDRAMFYPFGPDPQNMQDVENDLMEVILRSWQQNTLHPSQFGR
ncbi:MAG: glycoside hydrolase family 5 protein [Candidatus Villigracilaceae bacterium]